jgi:tight adherence protein B
MESLLLPLIIAAAVGLVAFVVVQVSASALDPSKRKLNARLTGESNRGQVELTQQRKIVQEEAAGLDARLLKVGYYRGIHKLLLQSYPDWKLSRFVQFQLGGAFGLGLVCFLLTASVIVGFVAMVLAFYAPVAMVTSRRNRRQRGLAAQLPEALDFLGRILKAGHSFTTGLQMMGQELPEPLGGEFRRAYDQHTLGVSIEDALKEMAARIDSADFAFFVTATLIQRQTGGDLSEVLNNITGMIRQRSRLQQQVKAKTAEGRFTGYILCAFPCLMFVISYVLNPTYAGVLVNTFEGKCLLGTAFGLQMLGLFMIKKITTVTV